MLQFLRKKIDVKCLRLAYQGHEGFNTNFFKKAKSINSSETSNPTEEI